MAKNKFVALALASAVATLSISLVFPRATETAAANGDTRTIHFYHTHTGESIDATFRVDGHYDPAVLRQLNHFLRDWRNNDEIEMDPRLFDVLWEVYRTAGADQPIQIYSAYRSPETNAMLRRRSRAVAEHSQHMLGKAMDTTMPGMSMERIREIAMKLQRGGVGYYQASNFVHIDVGGVRSWPRMSYDQLARLFPDGKTVHIPANGVPMARYEEARAEIAARGTEVPPSQESQGFFAWLFGGFGNSGDARDAGAGRTVVASNAPTPSAYANNTEGDEGTLVTRGQTRPSRAARAEAAAAPPPRPAPAQQEQAPVQDAAPVQQASVQQAALQQSEAPAGRASLASYTDRGPTAPQEAVAQSADRTPGDFGGVIPLPPRRPSELVASLSEEEGLPLPPVRPDSTLKVSIATKVGIATAEDESALSQPLPMPMARPVAVPDAIGGLIGATAQGLPTIHKAELPAIITQGTEGHRLPEPALAFAATETTGSLRAPEPEPQRVAVPAKTLGLRGMAALRGDLKTPAKHHPAVVAEARATDPIAALAGPPICGLRRAAKAMAGKATL